MPSVNTTATEDKQQYEKYEKEAKMKAAYYAKIPFDKYFTDFLSGVDKVQTGCSIIYGIIFGLSFLIGGVGGFIRMIIDSFKESLPWWQYPLFFLLSAFFALIGAGILYAAYSRVNE